MDEPVVTPWTPRDSKGRFLPDPHGRHHCDTECQLEAIREERWLREQKAKNARVLSLAAQIRRKLQGTR